MNTMRIFKMLFVFALAASVYGCSWLPEEVDETQSWSASKLYSEAKNALNQEDYENAIRYFEKLEARYPFGRYAQQAQLEIAYAYYKYDEPESAIAAADRFIKLHPRHPHVDYAYYLKGLVNFNRNTSLLDRFVPRDVSRRDPRSARQSFFDFSELVKNFPNSKYAPDARQRMYHLRNLLAKHEIHVARWYMRRGAYVAAANRGRYVVEHYSGSPSVPDALAIMVAAYKKLDMNELAQDAQRVLDTNYPDGVAQAKASDDTWWWPF